MSRVSRLTGDITLEAHNMLRSYCKKHERSKGFLLEKMIRKFCSDEVVVATPSTTANITTVEKKSKKPRAEIIYPANLNVTAWDLWVDFRKKAKFAKYKTDATMIKLSKMGNESEQLLIVQNSIDCQYQGLFPLKANNSAQGKTSGNLSACEDFING